MGLKGKLGRVIFRKIGGRIVPIRIRNIADKVAQASSYVGVRHRKIIAEAPGKNIIGSLHLTVPLKGKAATIASVEVRKEFRKRGISKNMFERASQFLGRAKYKFIRSDDIQHVAQVNIRIKSGGKYKAGEKMKSSSRFFADQFGAHGESTKRIQSVEARYLTKNNPEGRIVTATTMINKKFSF